MQLLPAFNDIILVLEENTDQIFFMNVTLLQSQCQLPYCGDIPPSPECAISDWTSFVRLADPPVLMPAPPSRIPILHSELCERAKLDRSHTAVALSLSPTLDITEVVPLAAVLLEYPIAYVPISSDQSSFLAGVPLDVYTCALVQPFRDDGRTAKVTQEHILMRFSCPCGIGQREAELSPSRTTERLKDRFGGRLSGAGCSDDLIVRHTMETHDRVSL
ncbi:uncharacterized protein LAESUDRAFT_695733 [Laetiporus sulphureus 93-53]|uniref:Uncharacterized protein n=1 Tax=Laetiporus sulphureus 93-53 TaxID=1314785 RepID=A0A165FL14_9APHY|nr:uncharacterized protein LAESUDRAFT_695733 [Laetiporus sulphureus 93-53]KZT09131.1 hypothetical protein LAESUDRAFT_695733 [Laetiporus sulphureus 93-53]